MIEISRSLMEKCAGALMQASDNYGGTSAQFARKYGMSASVWSDIKNGRLEGKLSPQKWLNIAAMLGVKDTDRAWKMARTEVYNAIEEGVTACKEFGWGMIFVDKCAIGKTYSAKYLAKTLKNCFYLDGSQCKTKILFTRTLAQVIGVDSSGRYQDVKLRIKNALNVLEKGPEGILQRHGRIVRLVHDGGERTAKEDNGRHQPGSGGLRRDLLPVQRHVRACRPEQQGRAA